MQAELSVLQRFQAAIGGLGRLNGPYKRAGFDHKPYWYVGVNKYPEVQQTIALLWDYVSDPKREQFKQTLTAAKNHKFKWQKCAAAGHIIRVHGNAHYCSQIDRTGHEVGVPF